MSVLGPRGWYKYTNDSGNDDQIFMRVADAAAVSNLAVAQGDQPPIAKRLKPRHVWFVNSAGLLRRKIYIGDPTNSILKTPGTISLDGDTWKSQGRVGEKTIGTLKV